MKWLVFFPAIGVSLAILGTIVDVETSVMAETAPLWYNCLTREVFTPEKQVWCDLWKTVQNASLIVPASLDPKAEFTTVTLKNGRYQRQDGKFFVEVVNEKGWMAFGDLNNDGKQDAAIIFGVALDPDGKAVGTYLTAVLDVDGKGQALTPVKLGERIMLNAPISISNGQINLPLLTKTEVIDRAYVVKGTTLHPGSTN